MRITLRKPCPRIALLQHGHNIANAGCIGIVPARRQIGLRERFDGVFRFQFLHDRVNAGIALVGGDVV